MPKTPTLAVIGAGNRGNAYGKYALEYPDKLQIVAVAEPIAERRLTYSQKHKITKDQQYNSWEELLAQDKLADGIIIATLDDDHVEPALKAMEKGYTILLEKPIAHNWEETVKIARKAKETNTTVLVAHVLRYTRFYREVKKILDSGIIGRIRFIDHVENIGFHHFAHSYVRGNWRNTEVAAPIILAKSCHDLDLLTWLLDSPCSELSSSGSLIHFTKEDMPEGAGERCIACEIENECPYSAKKIYLDEAVTDWPVTVITQDISPEGRIKALTEGPYGRCVYRCDNNVVDTQTVRMRFANDTEVNFALTAFSKEINRTTRFYGTTGEIRLDFEHTTIEVLPFNGEREMREVEQTAGGHGGGDFGLIEELIGILKGTDPSSNSLSFIENSMESHIMAWAAEESRAKNQVVQLDSWREKY